MHRVKIDKGLLNQSDYLSVLGGVRACQATSFVEVLGNKSLETNPYEDPRYLEACMSIVDAPTCPTSTDINIFLKRSEYLSSQLTSDY